jgi:hypothetical protein
MRARAAALVLATLSACTLPETIDNLQSENPPPDLGRPGFVQVGARAGAWVGGALGGVASVVLLPVTYPLSLLAECPLGYSKSEFRWAPASVGAAAGHWAIGGPLDILHYVFYRAWVDQSCEPASYDYVPMRPPVGPGVPVPAAKD